MRAIRFTGAVVPVFFAREIALVSPQHYLRN